MMGHRIWVRSTTVRSIAYDVELRILEIEFRSRAVYRYVDVPEGTFRGFLAADSKGRYFNEHVREVFTHQRSSDDPTTPALR